jgi:hypothetical protein
MLHQVFLMSENIQASWIPSAVMIRFSLPSHRAGFLPQPASGYITNRSDDLNPSQGKLAETEFWEADGLIATLPGTAAPYPIQVGEAVARLMCVRPQPR